MQMILRPRAKERSYCTIKNPGGRAGPKTSHTGTECASKASARLDAGPVVHVLQETLAAGSTMLEPQYKILPSYFVSIIADR